MNSAAYGRDINQEQWLTQLMEDHGTAPPRLRTADGASAEDAAQDTFLKACRARAAASSAEP